MIAYILLAIILIAFIAIVQTTINEMDKDMEELLRKIYKDDE